MRDLFFLTTMRDIYIRGVRGAVWFGFETKSHPNRKIKKHAV